MQICVCVYMSIIFVLIDLWSISALIRYVYIYACVDLKVYILCLCIRTNQRFMVGCDFMGETVTSRIAYTIAPTSVAAIRGVFSFMMWHIMSSSYSSSKFPPDSIVTAMRQTTWMKLDAINGTISPFNSCCWLVVSHQPHFFREFHPGAWSLMINS